MVSKRGRGQNFGFKNEAEAKTLVLRTRQRPKLWFQGEAKAKTLVSRTRSRLKSWPQNRDRGHEANAEVKAESKRSRPRVEVNDKRPRLRPICHQLYPTIYLFQPLLSLSLFRWPILWPILNPCLIFLTVSCLYA